MKILIELELEVLTPELIATLRAVEKDQFVKWREKIEELNLSASPPEQTMIPGPGLDKPAPSAPKPPSAPKAAPPEQTPEAAPEAPKKAGRPPKAKPAPPEQTPEVKPGPNPAAPALTADDVRKALVEYKNRYGITAAREKLAIFAVSRVDQLNPSDYSALLAELV